jgi:HEAT repeat protein
MTNDDINALKKALHSQDIETQMQTLLRIDPGNEAMVHAAVQALVQAHNTVIFADYLSRLGPCLLPHLEELYQSHLSGEFLRTTVALLLLHFGSRSGVKDAMAALNRDNQNRFLAASKLGNAGISEAVEPIAALLRTYLAEGLGKNDSEVHTLVMALTKLGSVPEDIFSKL